MHFKNGPIFPESDGVDISMQSDDKTHVVKIPKNIKNKYDKQSIKVPDSYDNVSSGERMADDHDREAQVCYE